MKNFKLIHETPDHFVLHNGIAHFHVAKSGITGETASKIRALAEGGDIKAKVEKDQQTNLMEEADKNNPERNYGNEEASANDAANQVDNYTKGGIIKKNQESLPSPQVSDPEYDPTMAKEDPSRSSQRMGYAQDQNDYLPIPNWAVQESAHNQGHYNGGTIKEDKKPASADQQTPNPDAYTPTPLPQDQKDAKPKKSQVNMDQGDFDSIPGFATGGALTTEERNRIPQKNFALPNGRYPIENESHARNALARVSGNGTPAEKATVRAKVHAKYPGIVQKFPDGGEVQPQPDATPTPPPPPTLPGADSAQDSMRKAFGFAGGGSIANETQSQAIKRYADGNPATLAKGGHVHANTGKNTLHFHFYDGASIPSPLDQYEGNIPNPGPAATPLDNYADGGKVVQGDDTPVIASKLESKYGPEEDAAQSASGTPNSSTYTTPDWSGPGTASLTTDDQGNIVNSPDSNTSSSIPGPTPSALPGPSATSPNPSASPTIPPEQQISAAPKASAPTPDQQPTMLSDFDRNMQLEQQGIQAGANAQSAGYKATAQAIGENQLQQKAQIDRYNVEADKLTAQNTQLFNGVAQAKVDPNHFWNSKSTGGKIASVIGVLLGGIGGGVNGTHQNQALQTMQRYQEQDIEAQKNDQSNKMNLYKMGLERYNDQRAASQFAMLQSNALLQGTLQKIAAQTGQPQAQATAQQMIGQLGIQNASIRSELALRQAAVGAMNGPQTQPGVDPQKLRLLIMAGVIPKDEAPMAQKEYGDYQQLSNVLDHTDQVYKTLGNTANYRERISQSIPGGSHIPTFTDASKQYQAVANDFLGNITKDTEGRVTPTDVDLMRPSLPQPGDSPQVAATKINNIKDQIREKYKFPTLQSYNLLHQGDPVATSSATRAKKFTERAPR